MDKLKFRLKAMSVDYFVIHNFKSKVDQLKSGPDEEIIIDFGVGVMAGLFPDKSIVQLILNVKGHSYGVGDEKVPITEITVSYDFEMENIKQFLDGDDFVLPFGISFTLHTVAYSTTRGILFEKMVNTNLNRKSVLPMLNMSDLNRNEIIIRFPSVSSRFQPKKRTTSKKKKKTDNKMEA